MRVKVGDKIYTVNVADTDETRAVGLSQTPKMKKGEGLLMVFNSKADWPIRMSDMSFPLSLIFINDDKVVKMRTARNGGKDITPGVEYDKVLEVNLGDTAGVRKGVPLESVGEKSDDGTIKMADGGLPQEGARHVLDENGNIQGNLVGSERIFSRKDTAKLYKLAKEKKFKELGLAMVKMLHTQNTQPPAYAEN